MEPRIAVIYFSATGTISSLAGHIAAGAEAAGADVRLRAVEPPAEHEADALGGGEIATLDDLVWADAFAFGTPTRFGNVSAQLKGFLDSTGPLALRGRLADKAVTGFTSASTPHGGQEATLLALYHTMFHWGALIVPTGYTDPVLRKIGGNPYGLSVTARPDSSLSPLEIEAARFVGSRITAVARRVTSLPAQREPAVGGVR
jgi:NAD(P)H dehydrogenase (quinone)